MQMYALYKGANMVRLGDDSNPDDSDVALGQQGRYVLAQGFRRLDPLSWGANCKNIDHHSQWYLRRAHGNKRLLNVLEMTDWTEGNGREWTYYSPELVQ